VVEDPSGDEGFKHGGWVGHVSDRPAVAKAALAKYASLDDPAASDESYAFIAPSWPKGPPYPVLAAIQTILDLQDSAEARAARPEDFVDARFVRELDEAGFFRQIGLTE
jgi:hypothetical protein